MIAYYNEIDRFAADWLRNLSMAGHIPEGFIDTRTIESVRADDIKAPQAHFFAGIGAWPYALELAGWPDNIPVWTGSCPCQPFSVAGTGDGEDDSRHLWPVWRNLIEQCIPPVIFGEQVASPSGRSWLASVSADLEALGYIVASADLCAAGVGAPHLRQRLFFGAVHSTLANGHKPGCIKLETAWLHGQGPLGHDVDGCRTPVTVADANRFERDGVLRGGSRRRSESPDSGGGRGPWSENEWIQCSDGKDRPAKPGIFPLAHGSASRVGRLRAYGNSIVPQAAAAFVTSFVDALWDIWEEN